MEQALERKVLGWLVVLAAGVASLVVVLGIGLSILISGRHGGELEDVEEAARREERLIAAVDRVADAVASSRSGTQAEVAALDENVDSLREATRDAFGSLEERTDERFRLVNTTAMLTQRDVGSIVVALAARGFPVVQSPSSAPDVVAPDPEAQPRKDL